MDAFDLFSFDNPFFGWPLRKQKISAAGRMLDALDRANAEAEQMPTSDELLCALKRADIKARREQA